MEPIRKLQKTIDRIRGYNRRDLQAAIRRKKLPINRRQTTQGMRLAFLGYVADKLQHARVQEALKTVKPIPEILENAARLLPDIVEGPYRVSSTALLIIYEKDAAPYTVISRTPVEKIKTPDDRADYLTALESWLTKYGRVDLVSSLYFTIHEKQKPQKVIRVAKYEAENCVINVIRHFLPEKVDVIYKKYPGLKPSGCKPVYLSHMDIKYISRQLQINIITYTQLGALTNTPWCKYGSGKRKNIHMKIQNEHATIISKTYRVSQIEYHDYIVVPTTTDVIDAQQCVFYTTLDGTMHKEFRPSSVTKLDADDTNLKYAYVFSTDQLMFKLFKEQYNIEPIRNVELRNVIKCAELFITKRVFEPLAGEIYEVDHNKSFASAEFSPFYVGFPRNNLTPVDAKFSISPAFYVLEDITNPPEEFRVLYNYEHGPIVLPLPTYNYIVARGATPCIDYIIDSTHRHISIPDFANSFEIEEEDKKLFRNSLIGRSITGGLSELKKIICCYSNIAECNQLIYECQEAEYKYLDVCEQTEPKRGHIEVHMPTRQDGLFHFHSYILAYSGIAMMSKYAELSSNNRILGYNVDAIIYKGNHREHSNDMGKWNTERIDESYDFLEGMTVKNEQSYFYQLGVKPYQPQLRTVPPLPYLGRKIYLEDTLIIAAAGVGKSHPFVSQPSIGQLMLTPTIPLRDEFRAKGALAVTAHKYFQFNRTDKEFYEMRRSGLLPIASTLPIDEAFMFSRNQWKTMIRRRGDAALILLGDPYQIVNSVHSKPVDIHFFTSRGFKLEFITRIPSMVCRHSYEEGCILDKLRETPTHKQIKFVLSIITPTTNKIHPGDRVIVGDHKTAHKYNRKYRKYIEDTGELFPFRDIKRQIHHLPVDTPNVWWGREGMLDVPPKGTKYEPAYAVTVDSVQGKTIERLVVDLKSLNRHGSVYTAMTRTRQLANTIVIHGKDYSYNSYREKFS